MAQHLNLYLWLDLTGEDKETTLEELCETARRLVRETASIVKENYLPVNAPIRNDRKDVGRVIIERGEINE